MVIAAMTRRRSPGSAGRSSRLTAGVETTPRTGEAVESEVSSSSLSSSSDESSSFALAMVTGVTGVEIGVVASFAPEAVAAVVAAAAVLAAAAAVARGFLFVFDGPGANRRGSPASS